LIPMQDPEEAAKELRRAVTELGMMGAMMPSNGLPQPLGAKAYWPIYEEADRLGCCLAVHGGCHDRFGLDHMNMYVPVHALGHPFGQMISFAGIVFNGVLDRYPNVKFGFMEGGVAWLLMCLERFDRSWETHVQQDPRGRFLKLKPKEKVCDYIQKNIDEGRIFVGCEGEEPDIAHAIRRVGSKPFVFSTDFPHEVNNEYCKHEIDEFIENEAVSDADKNAFLHDNAMRFYSLGSGA